jgi:predicted nucleotidyltransferase
MEYTKNKLPIKTQEFLNKMKEYLDTKLYFYGSVQRLDFFPNKSDIDICIFTDNTQTMIHKLSSFLHIDKKKFKKIILNIKVNSNRYEIIYCYKGLYKNPKLNLILEITVCSEKYKKNILLNNYIKGINISIYIVIILFILKFAYYYLNIIPLKYYNKYKTIIIDIGTERINTTKELYNRLTYKNKYSNVYYIDNNNQNINI